MTTQRQIDANRKNAQRSTGPRTPRGKAISSRNNTQHGLYSTTPVIPKLESPEAWAEHHATTLDALAPANPLEQALAERIALILWRISRVQRYEHTVTTLAQQQAADDLAAEHDDPDSDIQDIRSRFAADRRLLRAFDRFSHLQWEVPITGVEAAQIVETVCAQLDSFDLATFSAPGLVEQGDRIEDLPNWTVARLQQFIDAIADAAEADSATLVESAHAEARRICNQTRATYYRITRQVQTLRNKRIVPQDARLTEVIRYETHLTRQLSHTLNQLQQLQRQRSADHPTPSADLPDRLPTSTPHPPRRSPTTLRSEVEPN